LLDSPPNDVVSTNMGLFGNYDGVLYKIYISRDQGLRGGKYWVAGLHYGRSLDLALFIPGFEHALDSESVHFLKYLLDLHGHLHLFISSYDYKQTQSYHFKKVPVVSIGIVQDD